MFEPTEISNIDFTLPDSSRDALDVEPKEYVPATFRIEGSGGQTYGPVTVEFRLKGSTSFRTLDGKAAFKVKFPKGSRPWGLKKMTLNNMVQDPTAMHEALSYEVFREVGVPTSKTGYAEVTINDQPYGLYLNLETLDDLWSDKWFDSTQHIYEAFHGLDFQPGQATKYEIDEGDEDDRSDISDLIAVANTPNPGWRDAISPYVDLDEMVMMWAGEIYLGQVDGYVRWTNNHYVHSDDSGVFSMIPSGLDNAFTYRSYAPFEFFLDDPTVDPRSMLFSRCLGDPICRADYVDALKTVRDKVDELDLLQKSRDLYAVLRPRIEADLRRERPIAQSDSYVNLLNKFLNGRPGELDQALDAVPLAPLGLTAENAGSGLRVTWNESKTKGAEPVSGYAVELRKRGESEFSEISQVGPSELDVVLPDLSEDDLGKVRVRALSGAGEGAIAEYPVDLVTPDAPMILGPGAGPSKLTSSSSYRFWLWGVPGATFECSLDSGPWLPCGSPKDYGSMANGTHSFSARQTNPQGLVSPESVWHWTVDRIAPDPPVISLAGAESNSVTFKLRGEAGAAFECSLDGDGWRACPTPGTFSNLSQGEHLLEVRQFDAAGNSSGSSSYSWVSAPEIKSGPSGPTASANATFRFSGLPGATFRCGIDGGDRVPCGTAVRYTGLTQGEHSFQLRQLGADGKFSVISRRVWTIDTAAPEPPSIDVGPSGFAISVNPGFRFSGEPGGTFECAIDGHVRTTCTSPKVFAGLSQGRHYFRVRQRDAAGNLSAIAERTWKIDTVAPDPPTITTGPTDTVANRNASFRFRGEPGATFECALDGAVRTVCPVPMRFSDLVNGWHIFRVRQRDAAGNLSAVAERGWIVRK
ncbi:MAG: CotH kinase family protein [Thermoleophilales bacterium]|nr:CotH kinase family protein [Thermoleophilales bacterium]